MEKDKKEVKISYYKFNYAKEEFQYLFDQVIPHDEIL